MESSDLSASSTPTEKCVCFKPILGKILRKVPVLLVTGQNSNGLIIKSVSPLGKGTRGKNDTLIRLPVWTIRMKSFQASDVAEFNSVFDEMTKVMRVMYHVYGDLRMLWKLSIEDIPLPCGIFILDKGGEVHPAQLIPFDRTGRDVSIEAEIDIQRYPLPPPVMWESVVLISLYVEDVVSYQMQLEKRKKIRTLMKSDEIVLRKLVQTLNVIHAPHPNATSERLRTMCEKSRECMLERIMTVHDLSRETHPVLTSSEGRRLHSLIISTIRDAPCSPEQIRRSWGDAHPGNFLIGKHMLPIDPRVRKEFPGYAPRGLDMGFLVTDLWWMYRKWSNPAFKEMVRLLFEYYEEETGNSDIRTSAAQFGVPYRTAMLLKSAYTDESALTHCRTFVEDMQAWISSKEIDVDR